MPARAHVQRTHRPTRTVRTDRPSRAERPGRALDAALDAAAACPEPAPRSFAELGVPEAVVRVLAAAGVQTPFAIQARALPDALAGHDVLARAGTGSGKTLAFGLPVLTRLAQRRAIDGRPAPGRPRALIVVPTRELARQVATTLVPAAAALHLHVTTVFGGVPIYRQIEALRRGVDLVVATPGRLLDLTERGAMTLDDLDAVVLDEADCLSDMGFMPDVMRILDATPAGQRMLFSATLDHQVAQLAEQYLKTPVFHAAAEQGSTPGLMQHRVFTLAEAEKVDVAAEIAVRPARTLFFVRTKLGADRLARDLGQRGVAALAIHGNLNQSRRLRVLDAFAAGTTRVMVATDVAARGLHIDDVDLVVHYDPPHDHKDYLHRSGRTARAGAAGTVVSFVSGHQARDVARIHRQAAVSAEQVTQVTCGHPAVRALAESGEAIPVRRVAKRARPERFAGGNRPRVRS